MREEAPSRGICILPVIILLIIIIFIILFVFVFSGRSSESQPEAAQSALAHARKHTRSLHWLPPAALLQRRARALTYCWRLCFCRSRMRTYWVAF